jgi:hypothetical protein
MRISAVAEGSTSGDCRTIVDRRNDLLVRRHSLRRCFRSGGLIATPETEFV